MKKKTVSVLIKADYDEIRRIVKEEVSEQIDTKIINLPTKKDYFKTMDALMKEIKGARGDLAAHKLSHETIEADTTNLKHKVKHLYKIFEVEEPKDVIPSY